MNLTSKSESVPEDEIHRRGETGPATVRSSVSGSLTYTKTSGRFATKRWSAFIYSCGTPVDCVSTKGTGRFGSLTYSSNAAGAPAAACDGSNVNFPLAAK